MKAGAWQRIIVTLFLVCGGAAAGLPAVAAPLPLLELVESTPAGEGLDHADVRNTREAWLELIAGARRTLDLGFFYVEAPTGSAAADILAAVRAAAARGVRVRVISDTVFARGSRPYLESLAAAGNVKFRWWNGKQIAGGGIMHAKYIVADAGTPGAAAYTGSANIDWRSLTTVAELGVVVRDGELVRRLAAVFAADWAACATGRETAARGRRPPAVRLRGQGEAATVRVVVSPESLVTAGAEAELAALVGLIAAAETSVRIAVMKYAPLDPYADEYDGRLDDAIRAAAGRGVAVRLLVADWAFDRPGLHFLRSLAALPNIEVRAISFPDEPWNYVPYSRVMHNKFMIVDGRQSWVGSANWEPGYFTLSRNVGLIVADEKFAQACERLYEDLWSSARTAPLLPGDEPPERERGDRAGH